MGSGDGSVSEFKVGDKVRLLNSVTFGEVARAFRDAEAQVSWPSGIVTTHSDSELTPAESPQVLADDAVDHPSHYTRFPGVEVIQITEHLNFCRGNAVKYIARAGAKDESKEIEDLEKARWYLDREIERLKGKI